MTFRFIPCFYFFFLAGFPTRAEDPYQRAAGETPDRRYCDFDGTQKNYNAADLLRCIDSLGANLVNDEESGRSANKIEQPHNLSYRQKPFWSSFTDSISSALNGDISSAYLSSPLSQGPASTYYPSNYPSVSGGTLDLSSGIGVNLLDALSSISRYDDYKCVPRILCEVASGKLPGRSEGKQSSNFFGDLGKNVLMEWLTTNDIGGSSPILNFARATILGYTNRGNSATCYRAFPRCPSDPDGLVYYLNNHNGGFFRFFDKFRAGYPQKYPATHNQQSTNYYRTQDGELESRYDWRTSNKIRIDPYQIYRRKTEHYKSRNPTAPKLYETQSNGGKVVFPDS